MKMKKSEQNSKNLKKTGKSLVFVYGTLKRGKGNHNYWLQCAEFIDTAEAVGHCLYVQGLPFMATKHNHKAQNIKGEVYLVDDEVLAQVRRMEEGAGYTTRRDVLIKSLTNDKNYYGTECYTYNCSKFPDNALQMNGVY